MHSPGFTRIRPTESGSLGSSRRLAEKRRVLGQPSGSGAAGIRAVGLGRRLRGPALAVESSASLRREQPGDIDKRSKHSPGSENETGEAREPPPGDRRRFPFLQQPDGAGRKDHPG